jgi:hypothetical protein
VYKKKNYAVSEKLLPTLIKEKVPLCYRVIPPPIKNEDQWGSGGLQA